MAFCIISAFWLSHMKQHIYQSNQQQFKSFRFSAFE